MKTQTQIENYKEKNDSSFHFLNTYEFNMAQK